ncbi:hypothetical protein FOL47_009357 [Perkinsus chesapeaki]|uniref:GST N-terminal domain-containing protein n=1 Tax=Perkinsus chesapeaki TaxID=330153 RepID=A0A7J6L928_PERCH|nr:hypothetical protein FOL47_009357 [Perkinsus chesapeaki]
MINNPIIPVSYVANKLGSPLAAYFATLNHIKSAPEESFTVRRPPPPPPIRIPKLIDSMTEAISHGNLKDARNVCDVLLKNSGINSNGSTGGLLTWSDATMLMWALCALKDHNKMADYVASVGLEKLVCGCPPIELGYMAHYMAREKGCNKISRRMAASAVSRMAMEKVENVTESIVVALRVFTDMDYAAREKDEDLPELDWSLLLPGLCYLSEDISKITTNDLMNCLLGTGIVKSFEGAPEILGIFLKESLKRLEEGDLEGYAKVYRAACRNILAQNEDSSEVRKVTFEKFMEPGMIKRIPMSVCLSDILAPSLHSQIEDASRREDISIICIRDIFNLMNRDDWSLLSLDELTIIAKACFEASLATKSGWLREEGMPSYLGALLAIGRTKRDEVAHRGLGYVNLRGAPVYDLSAFARLMSSTRIFHYRALGTIADVVCDAPLDDISLKVCFRLLRASSSLRWYETEVFQKLSSALVARLTENGGVFSDSRPDERFLHIAPAIFHLALAGLASPELRKAIVEEFKDSSRVEAKLRDWCALLTENGESYQMRRLAGAAGQVYWSACAMGFIGKDEIERDVASGAFNMLLGLADEDGKSADNLGSLSALNDLYKFTEDLQFTLRAKEQLKEGALRSRVVEWLKGKAAHSGERFTEGFVDEELTGGYFVDVVIGDPEDKKGVIVAPRHVCYRSHVDGKRNKAPLATLLNLEALRKLGWTVEVVYESLLESPPKPSEDTRSAAAVKNMSKPCEIWQPAVLLAVGAVSILAVNGRRRRHERSRIETAEEMKSRCAAEKAAQDMLSNAQGLKGAQGKIVLRGPAIVTRGRTPLRLHYFPTRNRAEVARLLLEIGHEPYEAICYFYQTFLNCRSQFPFGELPVLELADGTMIVQQHTIVRYVADITRMNGGKNRVKQAKVDMLFEQLVDMFESHTFSWDALKKNYFKDSLADVPDVKTISDMALADGDISPWKYSVMVLKTFDDILRKNNESSNEWRWLDGSMKLSYADVYLFTKLYELSEVDQCGPDYGSTFQVPYLVKLQEKIEVLIYPE